MLIADRLGVWFSVQEDFSSNKAASTARELLPWQPQKGEAPWRQKELKRKIAEIMYRGATMQLARD